MTSLPCLDEEIITGEEIQDDWEHYLSSDDDECVGILIDREKSCGHFDRNHDPFLISEWIRCVRLDAIKWILTTRAAFGFRFQTAYLSVTYFDRFLARRSINSERSWAIKLLSLACVSLAAKMEEPNVPALSDFHVEEFNFEGKVIQRMELLVLNTLEWKMGSVTPFAFLFHLVSKMCEEPNTTTRVMSIAIKLIFGLIRVTSSMEYRPSVIAAAATLMAMDQGLTKSGVEDKVVLFFVVNFSKQNSYFIREDVFECYCEMQRLERRKKSPDVSPTQSRPASTSVRGVKRKRLQFDKGETSNR